MKLGVVLSQFDTWHFFNEIYEDFKLHYAVDVFKHSYMEFPFYRERLNDWIFQKQMKKFLEFHDVVFFEWSSGLLVRATEMPETCKIVTRLHRYEIFEWSDKIDWNKVDKIILVSETMLRMFSERFPEHKRKCVVIPVGISTSRFYPKSKKFEGNLGVLCHLSPRKRIYDLILAFNDLCLVRDGFHLHVGGDFNRADSDYSVAIQKLIARLSLGDKVTFYGNISDPSEWYRMIDIFVTNSYAEGMQVAPMEAMASGCYCLSHHWDGAEELVPAENLYISNHELINKILNFAEMPDSTRQEEKAKMRAIACEKFDGEKIKRRIRQVIEDMR